jgi:Uma2 family endonuclease
MATKAGITAEQYLHMTFEHDAEFVHGEIVERALPDYTHSRIQFLILMAIGRLIQSYPLFPRPELRLRLAADVYRVPDISVFAGDEPKQSVPSSPPLLVIEILSKDDRHHDLMEKLEEYHAWGGRISGWSIRTPGASRGTSRSTFRPFRRWPSPSTGSS